METVGFIGLAKMGTSIASNIQRAGYPMTVHDAREVSVPMPMINFAEQILRQAANRGWAGDDFTKPFILQEEAAGVEIRS